MHKSKIKKKKEEKLPLRPQAPHLIFSSPSKLAINATSSESEKHNVADASTSMSIVVISSALGMRKFLQAASH